MPVWTALGWKSRTRVARSGAPGSAPPPHATSEVTARAVASSAATLFIGRRRIACVPRLPRVATGDDHLLVYVEIPKGSRNKYEYDEDLGELVLDRFLSSSTVYPTDYGYLVGHLGRDGDPLDALVCVSEPTFPGCVIRAKPIALFKMRDEQGEDDKIVCIPLNDPGWNHAETLEDIPDQLQREITHFFSIYKQLEGKQVEVEGWRSREEALKVIEDGKRLQAQANREGG